MREPITKLAIVPVSSIDPSIVKQLSLTLNCFSALGGGNESPIIFFVARVVAKGERNATNHRILLITLKHIILYDEQGRQVHAVHIIDLARVVVCQDGFVVLKIPREHDIAMKLDQSLYLDYMLNILKVLHLHFMIGSPIANDVPIDRRRSDAAGPAPGLLVQGSATSCDQLTGGNKLNLTRNPNARYLDQVTIPSILNVDTAKQDFLSLLLQAPPPPKKTPGAPLATFSPQDIAKAQSVLQHPLFRPILAARANQQQQLQQQQQQSPQQSASLTSPISVQQVTTTAPPSLTMYPVAALPPSPMRTAASDHPPLYTGVARDVVEATPARPHNVTVRSIATIERDDVDSPAVSPRLEDRVIGGPDGWLRAAEPTHPAGTSSLPPPPPPQLSHVASPLQKLLQGVATSSPPPPPSQRPTTQQHTAHHAHHAPSSALRDRIEGFMKLYMPHHVHLVDRIAADYDGRDEECLKMLFARLEHEQQHPLPPPQAPLPTPSLPRHDDDAFEHRYMRQPPSSTAHDNQDATASILRRLELLEQENQRLRSAAQNKATDRSGEAVSLHHRYTHQRQDTYRSNRGESYDTDDAPPLLHPRSQIGEDVSSEEDNWRHREARSSLHTKALPTASHHIRGKPASSQFTGTMEEFESTIDEQTPKKRIVLRQHRLDELRKEVHRLIADSSESSGARRGGGGGMQSVIRIGLLQDEIVALVAKQQLDVALAEDAMPAADSFATRHQDPNIRVSGPVSTTFGSRSPSEAEAPITRSMFDHQLLSTRSIGGAPTTASMTSQRSADPAYSQWYYAEYLPRMMFQQQQQQKRGASHLHPGSAQPAARR